MEEELAGDGEPSCDIDTDFRDVEPGYAANGDLEDGKEGAYRDQYSVCPLHQYRESEKEESKGHGELSADKFDFATTKTSCSDCDEGE